MLLRIWHFKIRKKKTNSSSLAVDSKLDCTFKLKVLVLKRNNEM